MRDEFLQSIAGLAVLPFPERYVAYRQWMPQPFRAPPEGKIMNDENVALVLVMSENFPRFGVKRMGSILRWPNIQVHHILQRGLTTGAVEKVTSNLYRAVHARDLLMRLLEEDHA